ncbi:SDR family NAD(P)-dependent oxidoreductase [Streptomyces sp. CA-135486]|uniref:SDR family NAD(P)-dependent oxidoreductase n=1 Tax=Streptomyces sp. CA-135486 TaxID=3240049 RepID=UPI003D8AED9F
MKMTALSVPIDLAGRVILVTGGAGDIGSAIAVQAAQVGATVIIADNGTSVDGVGQDTAVVTDVAKRLATEAGDCSSVEGRFCDVTDADQVEGMIEDLFAAHGNVDAVIAAAGTLRTNPVWDTTIEDWRNVLDSHATHTYLVGAAACRRWRANSAERAGSPCALVTFTAATGLVGRPDLGVTHAAAKGAIAGMTLELAHEMYPYGVTVNAVNAASVRGRMARHVGASTPESHDAGDASSPQHAAMLSTYLATTDAGWITGQVFRVMGGLIGRYRPWELAESIEQPGFWTLEETRVGLRRLAGAYPEYKALQGPHREF